MNTYLLTWNPKRSPWTNFTYDLASLQDHGYFDGNWSSGQTKRIEPGDRLFLLRQGVEPRGIIASGYATSASYEAPHWDKARGTTANYVDARFDALLDPNDRQGILHISQLQKGVLGRVNWRTQSSGISIPPLASAQLEHLWRLFLEKRGQSPIELAEELPTPSLYYEGAIRRIAINAYERDPRARTACIQHHGAACLVCGFDFEAMYGSIGRGYIHVHHIVPLSKVGKSYVVDPIEDLCPVCPNCHAMLHRQSDVMSVAQLKRTMRRNSHPTIGSNRRPRQNPRE